MRSRRQVAVDQRRHHPPEQIVDHEGDLPRLLQLELNVRTVKKGIRADRRDSDRDTLVSRALGCVADLGTGEDEDVVIVVNTQAVAADQFVGVRSPKAAEERWSSRDVGAVIQGLRYVIRQQRTIWCSYIRTENIIASVGRSETMVGRILHAAAF